MILTLLCNLIYAINVALFIQNTSLFIRIYNDNPFRTFILKWIHKDNTEEICNGYYDVYINDTQSIYKDKTLKVTEKVADEDDVLNVFYISFIEGMGLSIEDGVISNRDEFYQRRQYFIDNKLFEGEIDVQITRNEIFDQEKAAQYLYEDSSD